MKNIIPLLFASSALLSSLASAAVVNFQNLNTAGDNGYGLFDESNTRLSTDLTENVRVGFFDLTNTEINNLWGSGDLTSLDAAFVDFGLSGMSIADGLFQDVANAAITGSSNFINQKITLFVSTSSNFVDENEEYFIFQFDNTFQSDDSGLFTTGVILGEDLGTLLVGDDNNPNATFDYGGGSALQGYNTASVVPEPSAFAAIAGILALGWVMVRRRA